MNHEETIKILAVLKGAYPAFYRGMMKGEAESVVVLWHEMFAEEEYPIVAAAVKALIAADAKGYPPHIGAVKARIRQLTSPPEMTELEAWALVHKAIRRSSYNAQREFDALPPTLQRLVGTSTQLRDWSQMDAETVQSVVASNFQRSYKVRTAADRDYAMLPADVKAMVEGMAGNLALGGTGNGKDEPR